MTNDAFFRRRGFLTHIRSVKAQCSVSTPPGCFATTLPALQGGFRAAHLVLPLLAGGDTEGGQKHTVFAGEKKHDTP
jgi:hypothetical protein